MPAELGSCGRRGLPQFTPPVQKYPSTLESRWRSQDGGRGGKGGLGGKGLGGGLASHARSIGILETRQRAHSQRGYAMAWQLAARQACPPHRLAPQHRRCCPPIWIRHSKTSGWPCRCAFSFITAAVTPVNGCQAGGAAAAATHSHMKGKAAAQDQLPHDQGTPMLLATGVKPLTVQSVQVGAACQFS